MMGISEAKREKAENFTIKQMMKTQKGLQAKIDKLNDQSRKDDVVTFEELGVDRIFIDESHYFKNLFLYTKMRNVGGIAQTEAQKSSDLFMKCRYLDEITGGRGIVFATGTPISNSMNIREMRAQLGDTQSEFSARYYIPFRTVQNWETGMRKPPEYVSDLLEQRIKEDLTNRKTLSLPKYDPQKKDLPSRSSYVGALS